MIKIEDLNKAKELLNSDKVAEAIELLGRLIEDEDTNLKDEAYYLRGNAFRRGNNWKQAIDDYTRAIELNPNSPALAMRQSCIEILDFYNKDMFNH